MGKLIGTCGHVLTLHSDILRPYHWWKSYGKGGQPELNYGVLCVNCTFKHRAVKAEGFEEAWVMLVDTLEEVCS